MKRRPPRSTCAETVFPYTPLFRSRAQADARAPAHALAVLVRRMLLVPQRPAKEGRIHRIFDPARLAPLLEMIVQRRRRLFRLGIAGVAPFRHPFEQRRARSEEHTSELQSLMRISYAVFCLKKKKKNKHNY